jgi:uncharacterized Zn-finger protein
MDPSKRGAATPAEPCPGEVAAVEHSDDRQYGPIRTLVGAGGGGVARRGAKRNRGWESPDEGSLAATLASSHAARVRSHTEETPYACGVCGQRFKESGTMKAHERTHTGEKPYACGVCGQRFSVSGSMKVHERTHTGEKPYACGVCGQRFSESGSMKAHERTHTGERPYACGVCGQRFSVSGRLGA